MARIKDTDVVDVRERTRIEDVIREVVTLKPAGGGSLKGLCPFHDERSPSFHVTPSKGFWHCFGCQEGGDVIDFVRKIDHLTFAEAVEKLANRVGVELRYEEGGAAPNRQKSQRTRLVEAHRAAADFYRDQLVSADAQIGRAFLAERGFTLQDAARFDVGFAPIGWDGLTKHLRSSGFNDDELISGGLAVAGKRGAYDRFRGRLMWPIRDLAGEVIGFGARRLREDDEGPKYLNTPETPIYHKSQVLYGVDLARREIARRRQAVVVEGYTDVMAAHLSGVETAVATCGTAFGAEHIKIMRRLLMDQDEFRGEVIFTFDGDAAGRKAALRAFSEDHRFVSQTFVAVEPTGLDPCELRQQHGPEAVRELVARRVPLFEFAIRSALDTHNLDTAEGRVAALRAAAPIVARIRDRALRPEYTRLLGGWLGLDAKAVTEAVKAVSVGGSRPGSNEPEPVVVDVRSEDRKRIARPDLANPAVQVEREALKCALQIPHHIAAWYSSVEDDAFPSELHLMVHHAIVAAGGPVAATSGHEWVASVQEACPDDTVRAYVRELTMDPLRSAAATDDALRNYGSAVVSRLLEMDATRRIVELKGRLQRTNPETDEVAYGRMFADLLALEQYRRGLREHAMGEV